jgi:hypothetical protein
MSIQKKEANNSVEDGKLCVGKILEFYGLSKIKMNEKLISVGGFRTYESGLSRYKCML